MNWAKLLSTKRVSELSTECLATEAEAIKTQFTEARTPFERDADQIIYSTQFRRLQDKTQVIPFPEYDFVHTRLTHTLEVASVGRSLGRLAGRLILKEESIQDLPEGFNEGDVADVIYAACLAHDIGNPPFGHSGEDSISHYMSNANLSFTGSNEDIKRIRDLTKFEGNANGFRIMARCRNKVLDPTCATLGAFSKYPRESFLKEESLLTPAQNVSKSQTKYGFFQTERDIFKQVAEELGLIPCNNFSNEDYSWKRHPFAFLMEAADDICYKMIDFEDGCRLGLINFNEVYEEIPIGKEKNSIKHIDRSPREILLEIAKIDNSFDPNYSQKVSKRGRAELSYLRSKTINVLTHLAYQVFEKNYHSIMDGSYDQALVDDISNDIVYENLSAMSHLIKKYVYNYPPVLESEAAGFKVIGGLLRAFADTASICQSCGEVKNAEQKKLESLLPEKYRPVTESIPGTLDFEIQHKRYLDIIDYISGMTDGFAISLYRKIEGIALPEIR
ncbi:dGTP triphosphohydrolase [Siphonobacter sp. SORGH_AS_0500]|uniref:dGTP triphosphohydrolase n=1 Tax=Siphonobacter sp. SORGH_AS_0500 TaxID=1864824 RepID=UPI002860EDD1|nr:dNTP triphosphohydrolase [Siphonobacter sp. SORGH_AS_0500]MDR6193303.1 dGTPase [Siphonobacter sp. SORGH_AS_0500]